MYKNKRLGMQSGFELERKVSKLNAYARRCIYLYR